MDTTGSEMVRCAACQGFVFEDELTRDGVCERCDNERWEELYDLEMEDDDAEA